MLLYMSIYRFFLGGRRRSESAYRFMPLCSVVEDREGPRKGTHGIVDLRKNLCACCSCESKTGIDESAVISVDLEKKTDKLL